MAYGHRHGSLVAQGWRVLRLLLAGILAVAVCAGAASTRAQAVAPSDQARGNVVAPAAPKGAQLSLAITQVGPGTASVTGRLVRAEGSPLSAQIALAIDGRPWGAVRSGGDGQFGVQIPGLAEGKHSATVTFAGAPGVGEATTTQDFKIKEGGSSAHGRGGPGTAVTARVTSANVTPGGSFEVSGSLLTAANTPIDQARIEVSTSWGDVTSAGATSTDGAYSVSLSLPSVAPGTAVPPTLTVTVSYAGDGPYAPASTTTVVALTAPSPPPPPPSIKTEAAAPPLAKVTEQAPAAPPRRSAEVPLDATTNRGFTVVAFALAVGAITLLAGTAALAWRRHHLLPGERRGFGTDFGQ